MQEVILGQENIFEDLGFPTEEATNLKVRADLMLDLRSHIHCQGWSQQEAAHYLEETPETVNRLLDGDIDCFSVDDLIQLLRKLGMTVKVQVMP